MDDEELERLRAVAFQRSVARHGFVDVDAEREEIQRMRRIQIEIDRMSLSQEELDQEALDRAQVQRRIDRMAAQERLVGWVIVLAVIGGFVLAAGLGTVLGVIATMAVVSLVTDFAAPGEIGLRTRMVRSLEARGWLTRRHVSLVVGVVFGVYAGFVGLLIRLDNGWGDGRYADGLAFLAVWVGAFAYVATWVVLWLGVRPAPEVDRSTPPTGAPVTGDHWVGKGSPAGERGEPRASRWGKAWGRCRRSRKLPTLDHRNSPG